MVYRPRFEPYAHQIEALNKMKGRKAYALLMEMRTGKTKVVLDDFGRLEDDGEISGLLVIAPAGVYRTWETAIKDHVSEELQKRLLVHTWSASAGKTGERNLKHFMDQIDRPRVLLVNVEALSSVKRARDLCEQFLSSVPSMAVVDESTVIKNHSSERTKFINSKLAPLAHYRRILTGTVSPNSPLDVYSQFQFLGSKLLGFSSYYAFRARYAVLKQLPMGGRNVPIVMGYRDVDELRDRIAPHAHRVRLADCYDMKEPTYAVRHVDLTSEQKRIYSDLKHFATAQLSEEKFVSAQQVITQILRLHQVLCGHTVTEDGERMDIAENRTNELLDLLAEYDGKAIIWCSYDADVRKVVARLQREYGEGSVARFWGGNQSTREQEEAKFKTEPACRFMVATAAAGGRGRNWSCADMTIYYSNTQDLEHREQSEARPNEVGKTIPHHYVDLVVPGTVDEKIIKALRNKINMASTISGDNYREWLV